VSFLNKLGLDLLRKSSVPQRTETAYGTSSVWFTGRLELLRGMSQQAVQHFNSMTRTTKRRRGEWIFVLGDPADSMYLLREGRLKITALGEDGHEVLYEIIGPGEVFGDTSTILGIPRTTSAQALEASLLCEIRRKDFETLLATYPELSLQLLKSLGLRLKKAEAQLLNVVCNDVPTRVREALIDLIAIESGGCPDRPVRVRITQQDLANLIGASRQKTWQALKELESANVLRLMYRSILVTAPHKLRHEQSAEGHVQEQLPNRKVALSQATAAYA
jgi:CRP/FNR family cyclic AMP-dependent transcriptional regulator